ncbi:hypothetical protein LSTR_LSTR000765 [Laodelphax striatellus]|uniref:Uncharacterized protein n=1 Tax=Laodelphax striatellus TaxID=195883 RepID=A0A482XGA4_LAOST|nr:hypothetical protein LSTR_LSTR017248 [Laodelphax striatellus]RZF34589.1 hypothetical protein LSTR_LSTR016731 [Laodelphax striatellus]RZF44813.1 hypothetical protein LSTR_LSTR000765 [Laodelphax striatellus]
MSILPQQCHVQFEKQAVVSVGDALLAGKQVAENNLHQFVAKRNELELLGRTEWPGVPAHSVAFLSQCGLNLDLANTLNKNFNLSLSSTKRKLMIACCLLKAPPVTRTIHTTNRKF